MLQIYFFEIQDSIQNHFIAAHSKEQAAEIYLRKFQPNGEIELEFLTHSGLHGIQEGSISPKRFAELQINKLNITKPQYIDKDVILQNLKNQNQQSNVTN